MVVARKWILYTNTVEWHLCTQHIEPLCKCAQPFSGFTVSILHLNLCHRCNRNEGHTHTHLYMSWGLFDFRRKCWVIIFYEVDLLRVLCFGVWISNPSDLLSVSLAFQKANDTEDETLARHHDIRHIKHRSTEWVCVYALAPLSLSHPCYSVHAQPSIQQSLPINSLFMVF